MKLGQNFLKSPAIARRIAKTGEIKKGEFILEIGPGKGILTRELLNEGARVYAVEKDGNLLEKLKEKFADYIENKELEVLKKDILELNPEEDLPEEYKIIANIPYYITGAILRHFLSSKNPPKTMTLLIQKEVAQNITGSGKEGILSLSIKVYGNPKYIQTIKKSCFSPAPKVDSAILKIEDISKENFKDFSEEKFFKIIKQGFSHPRKKLISNLSLIEEKGGLQNIFKKLEISEDIRPENLNMESWIKLAKLI